MKNSPEQIAEILEAVKKSNLVEFVDPIARRPVLHRIIQFTNDSMIVIQAEPGHRVQQLAFADLDINRLNFYTEIHKRPAN